MSATGAHRSVWAYVPAGLITIMLAGLLTLATIAGRDPGFALEPDYYAKALRWDDEQAQQAINQRLGWQLTASLVPSSSSGDSSTVTVRLVDAGGRALTGAQLELEAFANARSGTRIHRQLRERDAGHYSGELGVARAGLWELRFRATRGSDRFTHRLRLDAGSGAR